MQMVFSTGFPGLLESIYVQEQVVQPKMPDVHTFKKYAMVYNSTRQFGALWDAARRSRAVASRSFGRLCRLVTMQKFLPRRAIQITSRRAQPILRPYLPCFHLSSGHGLSRMECTFMACIESSLRICRCLITRCAFVFSFFPSTHTHPCHDDHFFCCIHGTHLVHDCLQHKVMYSSLR